MGDDPKALERAARAAKRDAHEWARGIRRRPAGEASSAVKLVAAALADRAQLITPEVAQEHGLPEELVGFVAAWPSAVQLSEDVGQSSERNVRGYLRALADDLVVHERRHLRTASIYVLANGGRPVGSDRSNREGDRSDPTGRTGGATGRIQPVEQEVRPVGSGNLDRSDPTGPVKEEPIREPRGGGHRSSPDESPGDLADRVRELLIAGYRTRFERELGDAWMGLGAAGQHVTAVQAWTLERVTRTGEDPQALVDEVLDGYFGRADLRRRRWPWQWLAEDPGRYATAGRSAEDELRAAVAALRKREVDLRSDPTTDRAELAKVQDDLKRALEALRAAKAAAA